MQQKAQPVLRIDETSNGQTLAAALGQTVEICLEENPTAGFRWRMVQTGRPLGTLLHDAFEPGRKAPGQPGIHRWQLRLVAAGNRPVRSVYRRSWEDDTAAARVFTVTLSVKK